MFGRVLSPCADAHKGLTSVLGRPGGVLLSRGLSRSTMGAGGFNGRVRNGIGWNSPAMTTRPAKNGVFRQSRLARARHARRSVWAYLQTWDFKLLSVQADRAIRTGKLNALLRLHTQPIDVVVFHGSHARPGFEVSFPLRCFQRLSRPHLATRQCHWRDNRSTRGVSVPVLSY